ncbi:hypothetical protein NIES2109_50680 [Nostoc sp. HK-01]|nr:hypothetical protein NIES2109_50680 [Nostoc sp. HK-01]
MLVANFYTLVEQLITTLAEVAQLELQDTEH